MVSNAVGWEGGVGREGGVAEGGGGDRGMGWEGVCGVFVRLLLNKSRIIDLRA